MRREPHRAVVLALVAAVGAGIALGARAATGSPPAHARSATPVTTTAAARFVSS